MASAITSSKVELWRKESDYRCAACIYKTIVELAEKGCPSCGQKPLPTKAGDLAVARKTVEKQDRQLAQIAKRLDELKAIPLIHQGATMTKEQVNDQRDQWVTKNRGSDETEAQARARFWGENPEAVVLSRGVGENPTPDESPQTVGELVSAAIDARARGWHLDGVHVEVPLVKLRIRIRETMPALKALERSQELVSVAKSRVVKAADRELSAAFDFVSEWS